MTAWLTTADPARFAVQVKLLLGEHVDTERVVLA